MKNEIKAIEENYLSRISSENMPYAYISSKEFMKYLESKCKLSERNFASSELEIYYIFSKFKLQLIQLYNALLEVEMEATCALIRNYPDKNFKYILSTRLIGILLDFNLPFEAISDTKLEDYKSTFMQDLKTNIRERSNSFSEYSKTFKENLSNYAKLYEKSDIDDKLVIVNDFLRLIFDLKTTIKAIYLTYEPYIIFAMLD